jgi:hypothetical protein
MHTSATRPGKGGDWQGTLPAVSRDWAPSAFGPILPSHPAVANPGIGPVDGVPPDHEI